MGRDLSHEIGGIAARIDCCPVMDENIANCATFQLDESLTDERADPLADPFPDPLGDHLNDRLEHLQARHIEAWHAEARHVDDPHEHADLLPRPTCVTCFSPLDGIAGGWWCDECQQFD